MNVTLVIGLGNPGGRYANTRHNVGFRCVDLLATRHGLRFDRRQADALVATGEMAGQPVVLAKPHTYMNLSGRAVRGLLAQFRLRPDSLIVVYDDLDLPLGRIRIRAVGSAGGHRGVQSIIDALGTNEFRRVRVGIGRPPAGDSIAYVLQPFARDEEPIAELACAVAADAIACLLVEGVPATMNKFNRDVVPM